MNKSTIVSIVIIAVVVIVGLVILQQQSNKPGKYAELATCLTEKGATFYGAFWCPNCGNQKKVFGADAKLLPYVECSTPDAKGQLPACTEKGIGSYPTWEFADGTRITGTQDVTTLAEKAGCPLPGGNEVEETSDLQESSEAI